MLRQSEWTETDSKTAALATAAHAANTAKRHVLTRVVASYSAAATGLLQVKHGTTVVLEHYVTNEAVIDMPEGLRGSAVNEAVSAELASAGGAIVGKVGIMGYTT